MPETVYWPGQIVAKVFLKEINLTADSLKCMLCTSAYAWNQDTHAYKSSVTNEVAAA